VRLGDLHINAQSNITCCSKHYRTSRIHIHINAQSHITCCSKHYRTSRIHIHINIYYNAAGLDPLGIEAKNEAKNEAKKNPADLAICGAVLGVE